MRSAREAIAYMKKVHTLVRYLGICDGNMQEGSFRCDANVSVRPKGSTVLGTRRVLVLGIPDIYDRDQPELIALLRDKVPPLLGS